MSDTPEQITKVKTELLAVMRANGLSSAQIEYSGSGDDGCIDAVQFEPQTADARISQSAERSCRAAR